MTGRSARGFTLLEMLVALFIFAVVMSALYGTFFASQGAISYSRDSLVMLHEMRGAHEAIRREIESASSDQGASGFELRDRDLYGRPASELAFTTVGGVMEGPVRVAYFVNAPAMAEAAGMSLRKRVSRPWEDAALAREAEFVESLEGFRVEVSSRTAGGDWSPVWSGSSGLPKRVRVTIAARVGGRTVTLSSTSSPMAGRTY